MTQGELDTFLLGEPPKPCYATVSSLRRDGSPIGVRVVADEVSSMDAEKARDPQTGAMRGAEAVALDDGRNSAS